MRATRKAQCPALAKARVDRFLIAYRTNRLDGCLQSAQQVARSAGTVSAGQLAGGDGKTRRAPATISAGGAVAGDLALNNGDLPFRTGAQQVIGGPEAGVTGSEDCDIDIGRALNCRPRR